LCGMEQIILVRSVNTNC